ncbi:MAG: universal stress protein, partial [Alphaproteobacteria bacterium]
PGRFLVDQARAADLVVIGRDSGPATRWHLAAAPGDVVLGLGRPLLVVPPGVRRLAADRIVVGWKNTAPSRRAIADALPLLRRAGKVLVVAVGDACEEGPEDVVALLRRHEVAAAAMLRPAVAAPPADELMRIAAGESADLIVTGAYGHARMREWILGGVTRALLDDAPICCLMSH